MPKFINHDGIADGIFNRTYSGGSGPHVPWKELLLNSSGVLTCLLGRMEKDYVAINPKAEATMGVQGSCFLPALMENIYQHGNGNQHVVIQPP